MNTRKIKNSPALQGQRIYLRALQLTDAANFLAATQIDELRYMTGLKKHFCLEDIETYIQRCLADPTRYNFAICLNKIDEMIGELSILDIHQIPNHAEFRIFMSSLQ